MRTISHIASVFVFIVGCVVLIGWIVNIPPLSSLLPDFVSMKANTAIAFLLAGISLWLLSKEEERINRNSFPLSLHLYIFIAQACAIALATIGLLTLCQYLFGWNLNIDELLIRDSPTASTRTHPGRMGANSAGNFVLIGLALWLLGQKTHLCYWLAQILSLVVALVSLLALIGYAYGVRNFYQFGVYTTPMALHTALTFGVLSFGVLYTRPDRGFMQTITSELNGGAIARLLIPSSILLPVFLGWLILQGQTAQHYDSAFSMSVLVLSVDVILLGLIWRNATFLNRIDKNRKRAETALLQSEERYRLLAENVPQMVWMSSHDGLVEYYNQRWIDYTGMTAQQTVVSSWQYVVHPDDLPQAIEKWETGLKTGHLVEVQYRLRRLDGIYRWHIVQALPQRDKDGRILKWFGTCTDIDDQKRAEEELRQSEARLRLFIESDIIGIQFGDVSGGLSEVNDAYLRIIGYSRKDFYQGQVRWTEITPPEYLPLDQAAIAEARAKGVCTPYEKEYIRKNGTRVSVLIGFALTKAPQEEAIAFVLDMSDRKRAEAELRESEQRFRHVTDTAPMMVWMSGQDQLCNYFNKTWLDFTGRTLEQEFGNGWTAGVHPDDFLRCLETYTNAFDARQDFQMEYRLRRFDGEYRWLLDIGIPRFTPEGEFLGYIGSCIDIQDRKQAEAQIQQINETLEERVKQRTFQLEAANRELESFSYSVSHDLRAPLRHITGFVDLLQKHLISTDLDATSQRYLNIITNATKQAGKLIDDLLTFSRVGRSEMRYTTVDIDQLVREVQSDLISETQNRQISWQIETLPQIHGDPDLMRLVLRNLLENALKYSKTRPQAQITVGSISSSQEVVFFVRDNGIGFDMKYAHKLFGVFQRLHSDPQFEGTGVGLANVQRIIHRHGGRVWAESEIDKVATFYFSLPRRSGVSSGE